MGRLRLGVVVIKIDNGVAAGRSGPRYSLIRLQALGAGRYPLLSLTQGNYNLTLITPSRSPIASGGASYLYLKVIPR